MAGSSWRRQKDFWSQIMSQNGQSSSSSSTLYVMSKRIGFTANIIASAILISFQEFDSKQSFHLFNT